MNIGNWLSKERLLRGLSQGDLAKKIGISRPTITKIENGSNPSPKSIKLILDEFG